jgi:hypothetical protein
MSASDDTIHDVFLFHSPNDTGLAELVRAEFREAGLGVYSIHEVRSERRVLDPIRRELAESLAAVILLTQATLQSQNPPLVMGMALAWKKPIFVLYDGIQPAEIPRYLSQFETRRVSEAAAVARKITSSSSPFDDDARESLISAYSDLGISTDQLLQKPLAVHELYQRFSEFQEINIAPERLVQELLRLRKQGKLPRVRKKTG